MWSGASGLAAAGATWKLRDWDSSGGFNLAQVFDAIREDDLKQLVVCQQISTYRMIGTKLIILKPKLEPVCESSLRYGKQCAYCGGFLGFLDHDNDLFCSLACQVNAFHKKKKITKILCNYDETKLNFFKSNDYGAGSSNVTNTLKKPSEKEKDDDDEGGKEPSRKKRPDKKMKGVAT
ncbi:hypothetical protein KSP40_PGU022108 [Platanthera guangdongensis]|uniref:PLATZ transcription factor family protein n=1 Tax=Platanthera guangdongensis TaxID=2320717 RepID=A0ABR2MQ72_9ASPA